MIDYDEIEKDPEVIEAMKFLEETREDTLENVLKVLEKVASYAYKQDKTSGDYNDVFFLIGSVS